MTVNINIPFRNLTLFVVGILTTIFIGFIVTEKYLSSSGFELRQNTYDCLVAYLEDQGIKDDYFPAASPAFDEIKEKANCTEIFDKFNVFEGLESDLYSAYAAIPSFCRALANNNVCGTSKKSSCVDLKDFFSNEDMESFKTTEDLLAENKKSCDAGYECFNCMEQLLVANNDYKNKVLHAKAVNFTIIDLKIWNYFLISTRVHELVNETTAIENVALDSCKANQKCKDDILLE